jgi:hypothetical protein
MYVMRRKIKAPVRRLIPFVVALLVGITAIWIWRHRAEIATPGPTYFCIIRTSRESRQKVNRVCNSKRRLFAASENPKPPEPAG